MPLVEADEATKGGQAQKAYSRTPPESIGGRERLKKCDPAESSESIGKNRPQPMPVAERDAPQA